ncbi:MmgE/PrpD family protein [Sphingomonas sp. SUN039]|uniref:MmgE/PrpD family protein n=1 Tax=Sphingomonas sp. SUN039 TaxID=2937787 RepID=UPI002164147A|nr:MmgE/PrpD family protein [Sphingomonas sp. SUN039]UVO54797.1 MmgE/PrpD family protein [Sphingomonas sp. SUN039]
MTHTTAILDFAHGPHALPPPVRADAERLLADTLAGGAAGAASPEAVKLLATIGEGTEVRLLSGGTAPAPAAAFFNGFAIHCLEWDAVHEPAVVHALSVVTAALLAASDRAGGSDPDEFLTALAVGVDIASGLGLCATGPMKFFRPATAGVIGAALAVARLEGLSRYQFADVLGLAYSFAGGTMQAHVEASVALPLQIGRAAQAAVQAVDLVRAGLDGPHDVLEGPFGYGALIEPLDLSRYTPGPRWRIAEVSIKPFPSGRASHGALGALQELRDEILPCAETQGRGTARSVVEGRADDRFAHSLTDARPSTTPSTRRGPPPLSLRLGEDFIKAITLHASPLIHRLVGRPFKRDAPMSYNRLCLAFLAPLMLRDGIIDPRLTETDENLARRVEVVLDGNPDGNALSPQRLVVTLKDGSVIERQIPATLGSPAAPMSPAQAAAKYDLCRALAPDADPRIFDAPLAYATEPQ